MLPASSFYRIRPYLEVIPLPKKHVVWNVDGPTDFVYFPRRCVLSLLVTPALESAGGLGNGAEAFQSTS
jgi:hypothetical protein